MFLNEATMDAGPVALCQPGTLIYWNSGFLTVWYPGTLVRVHCVSLVGWKPGTLTPYDL